MALTGNWTKYTYTPDTTTTETVETTYPVDLPVDDPNYDLRGQTITEEINPLVKTGTTHNNVYINVRSMVVDVKNINISPDETERQVKIETCYRVYTSGTDRHSDPETYITQEHIYDIDYDTSQDLFVQAYNGLKNLEGFENMIDA
jgi:hypothetical protein